MEILFCQSVLYLLTKKLTKKTLQKNREIIVAFCLEIWDNFFNAYKIQGSA
jgi:hypothetical protein